MKVVNDQIGSVGDEILYLGVVGSVLDDDEHVELRANINKNAMKPFLYM
jgi:hypothetical protein